MNFNHGTNMIIFGFHEGKSLHEREREREALSPGMVDIGLYMCTPTELNRPGLDFHVFAQPVGDSVQVHYFKHGDRSLT